MTELKNDQIRTLTGQRIAEVQYFFQTEIQGIMKTFALVSLYSPPDRRLL